MKQRRRDRERSGLTQVEGGSPRRTEVDGHGLSIIGVHVQTRRGQHDRRLDVAAERIAHNASGEHLVDVKLDTGTELLALNYVLNHAVRHRGIILGGVNRASASAIRKASHELAEGGVLTTALTDGGDINLVPGDLKAPITHLAQQLGLLVLEARLAGTKTRRLSGCSSSGATNGRGNRHDASIGDIGFDEIVTSGDCASNCGANRVGESDRITDTEALVDADLDVAASGRKISGEEASFGAGGLVVKSPGSPGQDSGFARHCFCGRNDNAGTARLVSG